MAWRTFKLKCSTEDAWKSVTLGSHESPPTECPDDAGHTVLGGSLSVVEEGSLDRPRVGKSDNVQSTTGTEMLSHSSFVMDPDEFPPGNYLLRWVGEVGVTAIDACATARVIDEASAVCMGPIIIPPMAVAPTTKGAVEYRMVHGFDVITMAGVEKTLTFQFASCVLNKQAQCRRVRWSAFDAEEI